MVHSQLTHKNRKCVELFMAEGMFSFVSCFNQKEVPIFPYFLRENIVTIHILLVTSCRYIVRFRYFFVWIVWIAFAY